jgi:hypothetical protein
MAFLPTDHSHMSSMYNSWNCSTHCLSHAVMSNELNIFLQIECYKINKLFIVAIKHNNIFSFPYFNGDMFWSFRLSLQFVIFLLLRLRFFIILFKSLIVLCVCFLFCVFFVFVLFCVLLLLLCIAVSFLFLLYMFTDHCHRLEKQLQKINIVLYIIFVKKFISDMWWKTLNYFWGKNGSG